MPRTYEQLSSYEREVIAQMLKDDEGWTDIGRRLKRAPSTIYREYHRNCGDEKYLPHQANAYAQERRKIGRRPRKIVGVTGRRVRRGLGKYWSPEQICGRGKREGNLELSLMTIYRYLYRPEGEPHRKYLRGPTKTRRHNRKVRERIHNRVMINKRPAKVEKRKRIGDWEGDTVRGPMRSSHCLLTLVDRKSQYLVSRLLPDRGANSLNHAAARAMKAYPFKTLTVDNGMEFASHEALSALTGTDIYFAHEKSPWERGLNEQVNGLLRQFFPKGTDFSKVTPAQLRRAVRYINERPRKKLGYRTPSEVMQG